MTKIYLIYMENFNFNIRLVRIDVAKPNNPNGIRAIMCWVSLIFWRFQVLDELKAIFSMRFLVDTRSTQPTRYLS